MVGWLVVGRPKARARTAAALEARAANPERSPDRPRVPPLRGTQPQRPRRARRGTTRRGGGNARGARRDPRADAGRRRCRRPPGRTAARARGADSRRGSRRHPREPPHGRRPAAWRPRSSASSRASRRRNAPVDRSLSRGLSWATSLAGATQMYASVRICSISAPVDLAVEPDPDPTAVADIRGHVEPVGFLVDELLLHAGRRRADEAEPLVVVMVVPRGGEGLLVADEPRRRAVAQPLGHLGQTRGTARGRLRSGHASGPSPFRPSDRLPSFPAPRRRAAISA